MKTTIRRVAPWGVAVFLLVGRAFAGAVDVKSLLDKMPAQTAAEQQTVFRALLQGGAPAIQAVCDRLVPSAQGGDSRARYLLGGLAFYAGRPSAEADRRLCSTSLSAAMARAQDPEVKAFLLGLLRWCGGSESVAPLGACLRTPALVEPATQALLAIRASDRASVLLAALPEAQSPGVVTLVKALGELRASAAIPELTRRAAGSDPKVRWAALQSLAEIGPRPRFLWTDYSAGQPLQRACQAGTVQERNQAAHLYLRYAQRLAEYGARARSAAVCREVLALGTGAGALPVQPAAFQLLAAVDGGAAVPELLTAAASSNRTVSVTAMQTLLAQRSSRAADALSRLLAAGPAHVRVALLQMLAGAEHPALGAAIATALKDADPEVRAAARQALIGPSGVAALLESLPKTPADELPQVKKQLLRLVRKSDLPAVAKALDDAPAPARVALLEMLAQRRAAACAATVWKATADADPAVRRAAWKAVGTTAAPGQLPDLVASFLKLTDAEEQEVARRALVLVAKNIGNAEQRADELLAAFGRAGPAQKERLLAALPELGGTQALAAVVSSLQSPEENLRAAAVSALAQWPDVAADAALLRAAASATNLTQQALLLRGLVRVVRESGLAPAAKLERYREALATARRADEKKLILGALVDIKTMDALLLLDRYLDDPEVRDEAASVAVLVACPEGSYPGLKAAAAQPVLAKVLGLARDEQARNKVAQVADQGFVPLFNGRDLTGWIGDTQGYVAENGKLVCRPGGNLYTEKQYSNFVMRFEFKLTPGANNGLGIRTPPQGDAAYVGMELQILDDTAAQYSQLQPYQFHGSIYGIVPARRGHLKPVGEWNYQEVTADGSRITIVLNGVTIVDADLSQIKQTEHMHKLESHPGLRNERGHIGFLGHGTVVEFRNIRLKELAGAPAVTPAATPAGFTALFNGRDLTGWKGLLAEPNDNPIKRAALSPDALAKAQAEADDNMRTHWKVQDGALVFDGRGRSLCTARDYGNFEMLVDWKIQPGGDSGVYLRGSPQVQIWDFTQHAEGSGGLYNNQKNPSRPAVCADRPVGEWNTFRIRMVGDRVTVDLNGRRVADNVLLENYWDRNRPIFPSGQIELQSHGSVLHFRNIYLREL